MDLIKILILILLILTYLKFNKTKEKEERNEYCNRKTEYAKEYNRSILRLLGKYCYIDKFGKEAYESIINNTDVKSYK